jgi:RND superfamily putative drug exporter
MTGRKILLYRGRWPIIIGAIVLIGIAAFYGSGLFSVLKGADLSVPGSDSVNAQQILDTSLHGGTPDVVILMQADGLRPTDPAFRSAAQSLLATLGSRQEVSSITSYYSTGSDRFLSKDGRETFAIVQLSNTDESVKEHEYPLLEPLLVAPPLHLTIGGAVPFHLQLNEQIFKDTEFAEQLAFPIVLILLVIIFRGVIAALLPLLIGGTIIIFAFAFLRVLTNITSVSAFAINTVIGPGLGLAIDYALLMVTRFRQELARSNGDVPQALRKTMSTAGRAVLFSGLTVSVSLVGLLFFPETSLSSIGLGIISTVVLALLCTLIILPAILALLGSRVNLLSFRKPARQVQYSPSQQHQQGAWGRIAETVMRWPIPVIIGVIAFLLTLGYPFLNVSFYTATSDTTMLPADAPARIASDHLTHDFAQQGSSQVVIAVTTSGDVLSASNLAKLDTYVRQIENLAGVVRVDSLVTVDPALSLEQYQQLYGQPQSLNPQLASVTQQLAQGPSTKVAVFMQPTDFSPDAVNLVHKIRALSPPQGLTPLVDGPTARQIDLLGSIQATIPLALAVIVAAIFLLLFLMTGSILVPLKAVVINLLSLTATFGALVWIFQEGHLQDVLNFQASGHIDGTQPVIMFAIAFGLSMDYEVFLLSRIKEEYDATGNNRWAVSAGLQQTGGLITSAALLLAVVLGAFSLSHIAFVKSVGIGLVIAILMDATIIRVLLVPATMRLLGKWNWWAPRPLQALWLRVRLTEAPSDERLGDTSIYPDAIPSGGQAIMASNEAETLAEKRQLAGISNVISALTTNGADIMGSEILVWRYPEDDVKDGSRLSVGYNQFCVLKSLGTIVHVYEPGQHVVDTYDHNGFNSTQLSFSGIPIRWYFEVFYINRARLLIKTCGVTLSREMAEVDYSVEYSIHIATREDAIRLLQHVPSQSDILILRDIHAHTGPIIKQVVQQLLQVTPSEQVNTKIPDLPQLMHQQLQSYLSNYGITVDGVQVLVPPLLWRFQPDSKLRV